MIKAVISFLREWLERFVGVQGVDRAMAIAAQGYSAFLPLMMSAERAVSPPAPMFAVTTAVDVDAPPDVVWQNVVTFSDIPAPDDWVFKLGVAYPLRARIAGSGPGAVRYCEFSTGPFVELVGVRFVLT